MKYTTFSTHTYLSFLHKMIALCIWTIGCNSSVLSIGTLHCTELPLSIHHMFAIFYKPFNLLTKHECSACILSMQWPQCEEHFCPIDLIHLGGGSEPYPPGRWGI